MSRTVCGAVADVGEVGHGQVIVPVVAVHRVVTRPVRALQVFLPAAVRGIQQVADVAGGDGVPGVGFQRVGRRHTERASARHGQVVPVAGVLFGERVGEQAAPGQEPVEVGSLPGVADDRAEVLILEIEQEHMLVAGHMRGRRYQPGRGADRSRNTEPQAIGDSPVIAPVGRVRAVEVRQRRRQDQADPRTDRLLRDNPGGGPVGQPLAARHRAHRADRAPRQYPARGRHERDLHRSPAPPGAAQPGRQRIPHRRGGWLVAGRAQPDQLAQPRGAPGSAGEQPPAAHQRPPPGGPREARRAVPHHRWQAAGYLPAGNGDAVPASRGRRARLRARIQQQVAAGPGRGTLEPLRLSRRQRPRPWPGLSRPRPGLRIPPRPRTAPWSRSPAPQPRQPQHAHAVQPSPETLPGRRPPGRCFRATGELPDCSINANSQVPDRPEAQP